MIQQLEKIWKRYSRIGVKSYANSNLHFEITSINQLAFLAFFVTLAGAVSNFFVSGFSNMIALLLIYAAIYILVPILSYLHLHLFSKVLLILNFQLFHFILAIQFGVEAQAQVIFLIAIVLVFLFFSENRPVTKLLVISISILLPALIFLQKYNAIEINLGFDLKTPPFLDLTVYFISLFFSVIILFLTFRGLRRIFVKQSRSNIDLINSNAALKAKMQEQIDLFAQVIHDLKSPIQSLIGLSRLMKEEDDADDYKMMLEKRDETLEKLSKKTREELEKFQDAKFEIKMEKLDLNEEIKEILDMVRFYHGYNKIKFQVNVNQVAPLVTDKNYLQVIIGNLVSNSIKYADWEKTPFLRIEANVDPQHAQISLEDNGLGIEKEKLPHIFNRLYRATEYGEGSGIGLSLVKKAVETLKGDIQVESEIGEGTKILLTIANQNGQP